jgi:N-acetylmuramoyl-L-alanine amidase
MPVVIDHPSPNADARDPDVPVQFILLHYTGMKSGAEALERLCDPASKVSAHYLIEEDGRVFSLVDEKLRAWHAGKSFWRGIRDINGASIGIELVNPGHQYGYRAFASAQINAARELILDIMRRHALPPMAVLAHADVAPARKEDPGELFPWRELAQNGIGLWPATQVADYGFAPDDEVQNFLRAVGYECPDTGTYDQPTRMALLAFQRHFHPENLTGTPEKETIARLRALVRLMDAKGAVYRPCESPQPAA